MRRCLGRMLVTALAVALLWGSFLSWRHFTAGSILAEARQVVWSDDPAAALAQLQTWADQDPENPEIAYLLAVARRRDGKTALAREALKRAEKLGWSPKEILRQQYLIDFQSGQFVETLPHLLSVLGESCPDEMALEIYECLVKGYLGDARIADAERAVDYWLQWRPDCVLAHLLRSEVLEAVKDKSGQMDEYRRILELDPRNRVARMRLAFLLLEDNDVAAAQAELQRCLADAPQNSVLLVALAECERQRGEVEKAERSFQQALKGDLPAAQRGYALAELGQIALARKSYSAAREWLEEAVRVSPASSATHYNLAMVLSHFGEKQAAQEHIEKSQEMTAQEARFDDVLDNIVVNPKDAALRCEAGETLLNQGYFKEASLWLLSALRCDNNHAAAHRALARCYAGLGNAELADRHAALADQPAAGEALSSTALGAPARP